MKRKMICISIISLFLLIISSISTSAYNSGVDTDSNNDVIVVFSDQIKKLNGDNGESIWVSSNSGHSILVNNNDDNFVASGSSDKKFIFNKFNGNNGQKILGNTFQKEYNYSTQNSMALDSSDDIIITGTVCDNLFYAPHFRWTIKVDGETGEMLNEIFEPNGIGVDATVFVDSQDNIIIFRENGNFKKYDNDLENELSSGEIDLENHIRLVTIDSKDNFVVATYDNFYEPEKKIYIMKFDSEGNRLWDEPALYYSEYQSDYSRDMTTDNQDNVIIVGESLKNSYFQQSFILKYDGNDGSNIWVKEGITPRCNYISTDSSNSIIVSGEKTKKYSKDGQLLWTSGKPSNLPPKTPNAPQGPTSGKIGGEYSYKTSTTDSDGDQIYYMFDWGDGNESDWLGPFDSGAIVEESHIWDKNGTYDVKVKAKDSNDQESAFSNKLEVTISEHVDPETNLSLSIYKGIFNMGICISSVNAKIENTGETDATDVSWSISVNGGLLGKLNSTTKGNIRMIKSGNSRLITSWSPESRIMHKFGRINIKLKVTVDGNTFTKDATGLILGRIIKIS